MKKKILGLLVSTSILAVLSSCGKNATSTEAGTQTEVQSVSKTENEATTTSIEETTEEHVHVFDQKNTDVKYLKNAADCTKPAEYYYSCKDGEKGTEVFTYGDKLEHTYKENDDGILPTCTEAGKKNSKTCTVCQDKVDGEAIAALGHSELFEGHCIKDGCSLNDYKEFTAGQKLTRDDAPTNTVSCFKVELKENTSYFVSYDGNGELVTVKNDEGEVLFNSSTESFKSTKAGTYYFSVTVEQYSVTNYYLHEHDHTNPFPGTCRISSCELYPYQAFTVGEDFAEFDSTKANYYNGTLSSKTVYEVKSTGDDATVVIKTGNGTLLYEGSGEFTLDSYEYCFIQVTPGANTSSCGIYLKHKHNYEAVIDEKFIKEAGDCTHKAVYYKSCSCGSLDTQTFEGDYVHEGPFADVCLNPSCENTQ